MPYEFQSMVVLIRYFITSSYTAQDPLAAIAESRHPGARRFQTSSDRPPTLGNSYGKGPSRIKQLGELVIKRIAGKDFLPSPIIMGVAFETTCSEAATVLRTRTVRVVSESPLDCRRI